MTGRGKQGAQLDKETDTPKGWTWANERTREGESRSRVKEEK